MVKDVQGAFLDLLGTTVRHAIEQRRLLLEKAAVEQEVRESRDRLERLAAQQALLLKEVNHRVANSLQLISSLIELQARKVADPAAREMLRRAAERVEAVSLVHRRLYTGNDVSFVDMDQYLAGLIEEFAAPWRPMAASGASSWRSRTCASRPTRRCRSASWSTNWSPTR